MPKYKNVIFDFDGTIANTLPLVLQVAGENHKKFGVGELTDEKITELMSKNVEHIIEELSISKLKFMFFVFKYRAEMNKKISQIVIFDDIAELLEKLHKSNVTVGIVTSNSVKNVKDFLSAKNVSEYVDFIESKFLFFDKYKTLLKSIKKYGLNPGETVYIGDEIRDVKEARKANLPVISVTWGYNNRIALKQENPDFLIDFPVDLLMILQA